MTQQTQAQPQQDDLTPEQKAQALINAMVNTQPHSPKFGIGDIYRTVSGVAVMSLQGVNNVAETAYISSEEMLFDVQQEQAIAAVDRAKQLTGLDMKPSQALEFMRLWSKRQSASMF